LGALFGAYQAVNYWTAAAAKSHGNTETKEAQASGEKPTEVKLSPEKCAAAGVQSAPVVERTLQDVRQVPGRIEYNPSRLLELKAPVGGVARRVFVQQGDEVERGDKLAILDGPEIGIARAEVRKQESEVELRARETRQAEEISTNLEQLFKQLN